MTDEEDQPSFHLIVHVDLIHAAETGDDIDVDAQLVLSLSLSGTCSYVCVPILLMVHCVPKTGSHCNENAALPNRERYARYIIGL